MYKTQSSLQCKRSKGRPKALILSSKDEWGVRASAVLRIQALSHRKSEACQLSFIFFQRLPCKWSFVTNLWAILNWPVISRMVARMAKIQRLRRRITVRYQTSGWTMNAVRQHSMPLSSPSTLGRSPSGRGMSLRLWQWQITFRSDKPSHRKLLVLLYIFCNLWDQIRSDQISSDHNRDHHDNHLFLEKHSNDALS